MAISIRGNAGAWAASNATTQTVTLPTHQTGDMLIVRAVRKPFTNPDDIVCNTAGWNPVGTGVANGATANGNGTGSMAFKAFYKVAASGAETNPVVTWGTTSAPGAACAVVYQLGAGESWVTPTGTGGGDTTARTSQTSTMSSHIPVTAGDMCDFFRAACDDSGALTVPTITQAGVTFGTVAEEPAVAGLFADSNDIATDGGYRLATAGTSSAAAVITGTSAASEQHGAWQTRLRVSVATNASAENAAGTGAANGPGKTLAPSGSNAAGSGAAGVANKTVAPNGGSASGTGAAQNASILTGKSATAGLASGTGAAAASSGSIGPHAGAALSGFTTEVFYSDPFDGVALGPDWEVLAGSSITPSVSGGELVFARDPGNFGEVDAVNARDLTGRVISLEVGQLDDLMALGLGAEQAIDAPNGPDTSVDRVGSTYTLNAIVDAGDDFLVLGVLPDRVQIREQAGVWHYGYVIGGVLTEWQTLTAPESPSSLFVYIYGQRASFGAASGAIAASSSFDIYDIVSAYGASVVLSREAPAEVASGTGAASDATVETAVPGTDADAETATGTGTAQTPSVAVGVNAGNAAGTGAALNVTASTTDEAPAGTATGTGTALTPRVAIVTTSEQATGTGSAGDATEIVAPHLVSGSGTGTAFDATVTATGNKDVDAGLATGTGTAHNATAQATGAGDVDVHVIEQRRMRRVHPERARGDGFAFDARIVVVPNVRVQAATARGRGEAFDASTVWDDDEVALRLLLVA